MIQTVLNSMMALMVAKFIINDLPHAAGLSAPRVRIDTNEEVTQDKVQGVAIAWVNSKDVGSLHYDLTINGTGRISFTYIDPEYRGLGVGKSMYTAVENLAKEYGVSEISLEVGLIADAGGSIEEAKGFWRRLGFTLEDNIATKKLLGAADIDSWDNVWKSCVQAAKILGKELTEQDIPANWPEMRRLHKDLWAQVYGKRQSSNPGNFRLERTPVDSRILDHLEQTWHRIEPDTSYEMQSALGILKEVMGYYYEELCVVVWDNSNLVGIAVYETTYDVNLGIQNTNVKELASFTHEPGVGKALVEEVVKIGREEGSDIVSLSHGPGVRPFYEKLGFVQNTYYPGEPTLMMYELKSSSPGSQAPLRGSALLDRYHIELTAFWQYDYKSVLRMLEGLDGETLSKLYGMTINVTDKPLFPHPVTGELMAGDTRYFREKPYLIILGSKTTSKIFYHEIAHAIGIESEEEAEEWSRERLKHGN